MWALIPDPRGSEAPRSNISKVAKKKHSGAHRAMHERTQKYVSNWENDELRDSVGCCEVPDIHSNGRGRIRTCVGVKPTGLQPVPFGRSGTRPVLWTRVAYYKRTAGNCQWLNKRCLEILYPSEIAGVAAAAFGSGTAAVSRSPRPRRFPARASWPAAVHWARAPAFPAISATAASARAFSCRCPAPRQGPRVSQTPGR